jgi:hypothetical protein
MAEDNNNKDALGIARLEVQLTTVLSQLSSISKDMVTKDLFTAQNANVEYRFKTVEDQVSQGKIDSARTLAQIESDSKARDLLTSTEATRRDNEIINRLDKTEERQFQIEQAQKAQKNSKWTSFGVTILGALIALAGSALITLVNTLH